MVFDIVGFDVLESTNTEALTKDYPEGTIIWAQFQTKGRGQRGNIWNAKASENLTFSVVLCPGRLLLDSYPISMAAALAVVKTLNTYGIEAKIKWPNDIYVGDLKIAGILIENSLSSDSVITKSVIGVGLNVLQTTFPDSIPNPVSMLLLGVKETTGNVLSGFVKQLSDVLELDDSILFEEYMGMLWRKDGYFPYQDDTGRFLAEIKNVNPHTGRLTLLKENGEICEYYFKEVQALLK